MVHWPSSCAGDALAGGAARCCGAARARTLPRRSALVGSRMPQTTSPSHPWGRSAMLPCWMRRLVHFGISERGRRKLSGFLDPSLPLVELHPEQQAAAAAVLARPGQHVHAPLTTDASHLAGPQAVRTPGVAHAAWPFDLLRPLPVPSHTGGSGQPFVEGVCFQELADARRHSRLPGDAGPSPVRRADLLRSSYSTSATRQRESRNLMR